MTSATSQNVPPVLAAVLHLAARRPDIKWQEVAVCRQIDPELFFPIGSAGAAVAEIQRAKAVCAGWGGRDENERRLLHRQWRESRADAMDRI